MKQLIQQTLADIPACRPLLCHLAMISLALLTVLALDMGRSPYNSTSHWKVRSTVTSGSP